MAGNVESRNFGTCRRRSADSSGYPRCAASGAKLSGILKNAGLIICVLFSAYAFQNGCRGCRDTRNACLRTADTDSANIPVTITVERFVEITVLDPTGVEWEVTGTGHNGGDMGFHTGTHARFQVIANDDFTLTMESSNGTWEASNLIDSPYDTYKQVKYLKDDESGAFIGGSLYLRPVETTNCTQGFQYWDGQAGNIELAQLAGWHVWGVAVDARAELTGNSANSNGIEDAYAAPGLYKTDAVITASIE
jgi:hypothetical protein